MSSIPACSQKSKDGPAAEYLNEVSLIRMVHRHDNFITFNRSDYKQFVAMRPSELESMLPTFADQLIADAYYSISGMRRKWRTASLVSHFTSCFADIDLHDDPSVGTRAFDVSVEKLIARAITLAAESEIPAPSIIVRSGRGFWLFWLLTEPGDSELAVICSPDTRAIWTRMQRTLAARLAKCGIDPDRAALSPERLTRFPNSINTRAGRRVAYTVNLNADGKVSFYTLSEIASILRIDGHPAAFIRLLPQSTQRFGGRGVSRRANGWRALRDRRLRDYEILLELRGGYFQEGVRNRAALLLAFLCRGDPHQTDRVWQFGTKCCAPPLTAHEITGALKTVGRGRRFKIHDRKIGDWLGLTPAANDQLDGEYLLERSPNREAPRDIRASRRREVISEMCSVRVPTLRDINSRLEALGLGCSIVTIRKDLGAIGIVNPRVRLAPRQIALLGLENATARVA